MFWILYGHIGKATVSNHTGEKGFALVFIDDFYPEITYELVFRMFWFILLMQMKDSCRSIIDICTVNEE